MTLEMIGWLATGMSALGRFSVSGLSLVPRPAARIIAFMGKCLKGTEVPKMPKVPKV
jgi:hypothetical protein